MDRREQILDAAFELAADEGLEAVNQRGVAKKIGINHATVHYYFARREDLVLALASNLVERLKSDRSLAHEEAESPMERLEAELALAEGYAATKSRQVRALAALLPAAKANKKIRAEVATWAAEFASAHADLSGLRKKSPFQDSRLLTAALMGLAVLAQADRQPVDAQMDAIFESLGR